MTTKPTNQSLKHIEDYNGKAIWDDGGAIFVCETTDTAHRFYVGLDDSKNTGERVFQEDANNAKSAREYIDWLQKHRKPKGTTKPTGGKWNYHNENNEEYFDIESNGNRICSIVAHDEEAEDNARAICEAVNATWGNGINPESVPMMLEALLEAEARLLTFEESNAWEPIDAQALTQIREAINAAKQ